MKNIKNKQLTSGKGVSVAGGARGMIHGQQHTGTQKPGVSGVSKGPANKQFGAKGGSGHMMGKQSVVPAVAGQSGKNAGGSGKRAGGGGGGGRKKGYADDANGNNY